MTDMRPRDRQSALRIADAIVIAGSKDPADAKRWIMRARLAIVRLLHHRIALAP